MSDTIIDEESEAARQQRTTEAMQAAGVATEEVVQADYFGFEETERVFLPDKFSYIEIKALNEGGRRRYLNMVNREVRLTKGSGDAIMKMANGDERKILIQAAIVGWNLQRRNPRTGTMDPVSFSEKNLTEFLEKVSPLVLDKVDKAVRKQNPWLLQDATIEDLEQQMAELQEMIDKKRAEEEGKES